VNGHLLATILDAAAHGNFPDPDGTINITPPAPGDTQGVVAFTAHHVIAAAADSEAVRSRLDPTDLGSPLLPGFLEWLGRETGRQPGNLDLVLAALASGAGTDLEPIDDPGHPRVARALKHRSSARIHGTESGLFVIGRGLARRWEVSIQVRRGDRGTGLGTDLASAARDSLPEGTPLFAQVAPGNSASLRAFLGAGFAPIGAEVLFPA